MTRSMYLSISTIATSLLVLAGCTQTGTNTNTAVNTNVADPSTNVEVATNTNATVNNENTNDSNVNAEVDTSDPALSEVEGWLTYTNEDYGFSFRYPREWEVYTNNAGLPFLRVIDENANISVSPKIFVDEDIIPPGTDTATALKLENGREASPLIQDEYLVINNLKAYKAFRQIKKDEPSGYEGEPSEKTWTDIEYSYLSDNDLIRFWFTIQGEDYQKYIPIIDNIGQSVTK